MSLTCFLRPECPGFASALQGKGWPDLRPPTRRINTRPRSTEMDDANPTIPPEGTTSTASTRIG